MKQFVADRHTTPGTATLEPVNIPKVPVYDTAADAEADLANLNENQIIATLDTGNENAQPVNVVEEDNLHAVTSDAVARYVKGVIADAVKDNTKFALGAVNVNVKANYSGILYAIFSKSSTNGASIYEDDVEIWRSDIGGTTFAYSNATILIRKGHNYKWSGANVSAITSNFIPLFN